MFEAFDRAMSIVIYSAIAISVVFALIGLTLLW